MHNALILFLTQIFHLSKRGLSWIDLLQWRRPQEKRRQRGKAGDYSLLAASHTKRKHEAHVIIFNISISNLHGKARVFAVNELRLRLTVFRWCAKPLHPCTSPLYPYLDLDLTQAGLYRYRYATATR